LVANNCFLKNHGRGLLVLLHFVQKHGRGLLAATVFLKTTVVGCSFYSTLCKTPVVGRLPPIISRKYYLRITPDGYKGSTFFAFYKKIKK